MQAKPTKKKVTWEVEEKLVEIKMVVLSELMREPDAEPEIDINNVVLEPNFLLSWELDQRDIQ